MHVTRRDFVGLSAVAALGLLAGCSDPVPQEGESIEEAAQSGDVAAAQLTGPLALDASAWSHDEDHDVYWQIGLPYCATPEAPDYEQLGIFVPGAYMSAQDNGDGTFTCHIGEGSISGFSAHGAPIVMPVNTAGYSAQQPPARYDYESIADYLEAGFVYVHAGCRGRSNGYDDEGSLQYSGGAPWGVTDLKAAVRYLRYNATLVPGSTDDIFAFGHSGGGAQAAVLGASGDSDLYLPYLQAIGAAMTDDDGADLSDAIGGVASWCPITCLGQADGAYEWMMGQYADEGTRAPGTWTAALSGHLARRFAEYVNEAGFVDEEGQALKLEEGDDGIFAAGSYHDHVLGLVDESLNNFLGDTTFPYAPDSHAQADGGFGGGLLDGLEFGEGLDEERALPGGRPGGADGPGGGLPEGELPEGGPDKGGEAADGPGGAAAKGASDAEEDAVDEGGTAPDGEAVADATPDGEGGADAGPDGDDRTDEGADGEHDGAGDGEDGENGDEVVYETAEDYIAALNADEEWIAYDAREKTAHVRSLAAFARHCKKATKAVGAFDMLDRSAAENELFGNDDHDALHFDGWMAELLSAHAEDYAELGGWDGSYAADYAADRELADTMGTPIDERMAMYDPLHYLHGDGAGDATVARHWRVHSGIEQGDTSLTTEANLALALHARDDVDDVEFITVWGQGHVMAERAGNATDNVIAWVKHIFMG